MTISLDFSGLAELVYLPLGTVLWRVFFWYFGWMPIAIVLMFGIIEVWLKHQKAKWASTQKHIVLAIDLPRNNEQSPRAVENMFVYFAGAHASLTLIEKYWDGKFQLGFSFEIVSIGGFIQFLVHTPASFRNMVETAVYSQYPDAEIYEVEDYTKTAPDSFPDEEYDIWGTEIVQVADPALPIRLYQEFEHQFGAPEVQYKDPMAALMDLMSSLQKGEQLWYQIVLIPIDQTWVKMKDKFISKILKEKLPGSKANGWVDTIMKWIGDFSEQIYSIWGDIDEKKSKEDDPLKMMNLKPSLKKQIESAELKASKVGFDVSIRGVYLSRKEVMNKPKAVNGFVGYIKQFNTNDLNSLKPDTKITMTSASYFFIEKRLNQKKNNIMRAYKERSDIMGREPWVMNVEELATLWHFPIDAVVKAPLVQRAGARRVEPPMALPFDEGGNRMNMKRDPIFDEGYEVEEDAVSTASGDDAPTEKTERRKQGSPGFMDPDDVTPDETTEVPASEENYKPGQTIEAEESLEEDKVAAVTADPRATPGSAADLPAYRPSEERLPKVPANLPFED